MARVAPDSPPGHLLGRLSHCCVSWDHTAFITSRADCTLRFMLGTGRAVDVNLAAPDVKGSSMGHQGSLDALPAVGARLSWDGSRQRRSLVLVKGMSAIVAAATVVGGSVAGEGPQPGSYVWKTRLLPAVKVRGLGGLTVNALTSAAGRGCPDNIRADHGMELRVLAEAAVRRGSVATGARCPGAA